MNLIHNAAHVLPIRPSESVFSDYYLDRMDWVPARNIYMTKEQFARFFELTTDEVDEFPINREVVDITEIGIEFHGFKLQMPKHINPRFVVKVQYFPHNPAYEMLNFNLLMGVSNAN